MASPTGIKTRDWIWLRSVEFVFAIGSFIVACIQGGKWPVVLGMTFAHAALSLLMIFDASIYYKRRYARGAGSISTLRWIGDLAQLALVATLIAMALLFSSHDYALTFVVMGFAGTNTVFYFSTFVMMCVEDSRLRKQGRALLPSATAAMPSTGAPMYRGEPPFSAFEPKARVSAERAVELVNNILANGFTVEHLEKMGVTPIAMPVPVTVAPKRDFEPGPPHYNA